MVGTSTECLLRREKVKVMWRTLPHPTPGSTSSPQAWQQAEGAGMAGKPNMGSGHSDYSPGCPVRRRLRMQTAASSSASWVPTALGMGKPLRSVGLCTPGLRVWTVYSPEAQGTKETFGSPPLPVPGGREVPRTCAPRGSFPESQKIPWGQGTWWSWDRLPCALDTLGLQERDPQACPGLAHAGQHLCCLSRAQWWCWAENAMLSEGQSPSRGQL